MMNSGVYQIKNSITGDLYIGSTVSINKRGKEHFSSLARNANKCRGLQSAVNEFGIKNFTIAPLITCSKQYLMAMEQWFIDTLKPKYNIHRNTSTPFGCPVDQYDLEGALIKRWSGIRVAARSLKIQLRKFNKSNLTIGGFVWIKDGQPLPDFSAINERKKNKSQSKSVLQIDKNGNTVAEFYGVREACRITKIDHRSISQVAAGSKVRKTAGGFIWKYKKEKISDQ